MPAINTGERADISRASTSSTHAATACGSDRTGASISTARQGTTTLSREVRDTPVANGAGRLAALQQYRLAPCGVIEPRLMAGDLPINRELGIDGLG